MKKASLLLFSILINYLLVAQALIAPNPISHIREKEMLSASARISFRENSYANNYDIIYSQCYWNIDPAVRFISGHINTYFIPKEDISSITLDLSDSLKTDSVLFQGKAASFSHTNNFLQITFPFNLIAGTTYNADVYYHGVPTKDTNGFGSFAQMKHGRDSTFALWTLSEPFGASLWWPCKNSLADKIDSLDIFVTTPSKYKDASNGVLIAANTSNGFTTYHWKTHYPTASYLVALNVAEFACYNDTSIYQNDTLLIQNFIWKEDSASVSSLTRQLLPCLHLYDSLFGIYPFHKEKYGHAQMGAAGGMEHQTITYAGYFARDLLAHECGHQWFGDKITCATWEDIFLNEGFATYLEDLCYEFTDKNWWPVWKTDLLNTITSQTGGSIHVNDTTKVSRIFDERLTYYKGSYFLRMLRYQIKDSAFFAAVRNYLDDPKLAYGFARIGDLKKHFEASSGKDLTTYFDQWYFKEGFPSYHVYWSQDSSNTVNLIMDQTTSMPSSVSFFFLDVPVQLKNSKRDTIVRLTHTSNGQQYTFHIPFRADSILFDPDQWLISAKNIVTGIQDISSITSNLTVYPNPASSIITIYTNNQLPLIESVELLNVIGERMLIRIPHQKVNSLSFDCSNITYGVYFLRINTIDGLLNKKVIISR